MVPDIALSMQRHNMTQNLYRFTCPEGYETTAVVHWTFLTPPLEERSWPRPLLLRPTHGARRTLGLFIDDFGSLDRSVRSPIRHSDRFLTADTTASARRLNATATPVNPLGVLYPPLLSFPIRGASFTGSNFPCRKQETIW